MNAMYAQILVSWDSVANDAAQLKLKRIYDSKSIMAWSELLRDAHLDSSAVKERQGIKEETALGTIGTTGNSTAVHLHLGLKSSAGTWENPHTYD